MIFSLPCVDLHHNLLDIVAFWPPAYKRSNFPKGYDALHLSLQTKNAFITDTLQKQKNCWQDEGHCELRFLPEATSSFVVTFQLFHFHIAEPQNFSGLEMFLLSLLYALYRQTRNGECQFFQTRENIPKTQRIYLQHREFCEKSRAVPAL